MKKDRNFCGIWLGGYQYNGLSYIELEVERIDAQSGLLLSEVSELTQTVAA